MHCYGHALPRLFAAVVDTQPATSLGSLLQVLVNGRPRSRGFRSITAYVLQASPLLLLL